MRTAITIGIIGIVALFAWMVIGFAGDDRTSQGAGTNPAATSDSDQYPAPTPSVTSTVHGIPDAAPAPVAATGSEAPSEEAMLVLSQWPESDQRVVGRLKSLSGEPFDRLAAAIVRRKHDLPRFRELCGRFWNEKETARLAVDRVASSIMAARFKVGRFESRPAEPHLDASERQAVDTSGQPQFRGAGPAADHPEQVVMTEFYVDVVSRLAMERFVRINPGDSPGFDQSRAEHLRTRERIRTALLQELGL